MTIQTIEEFKELIKQMDTTQLEEQVEKYTALHADLSAQNKIIFKERKFGSEFETNYTEMFKCFTNLMNAEEEYFKRFGYIPL